jgi:ABC-type nitrate/sulfonate/bicarbonate transport system permease component
MNNSQKRNLFLLQSIPVVALLLLWQFISQSGIVNANLFPPPTKVWVAFLEWVKTGELWQDVRASFWRMFTGFFIGGFIGIIIGILTGRNHYFNIFLKPIVQLFRPLPPVAIIPLIIVWFGIGDAAKVFSIAFAVFFPVWVNTHLGAAAIPANYLWSARLLTHSKLKTFIKVLLPASTPSIVAGLRTAIAMAFIMVYVSEIAGASEGLGYQISVSHLAYRIDKMIAALIFLGITGALADGAFAKAITYFFPWLALEAKR